jgi:hypothetical protein
LLLFICDVMWQLCETVLCYVFYFVIIRKDRKTMPTPKIKNYPLLYDISPWTFISLQNYSSVKK